MPPIVAAAAIAGGATLAGAGINAHANSGAAKVEGDYNAKALEAAKEQHAFERAQQTRENQRADEQRTYQRQQFADYSGRLAPFIDAGTSATQTASGLLASSPYASRAGASATAALTSDTRAESMPSFTTPGSRIDAGQRPTVITLAPPPGRAGQPRQFAADDPAVKYHLAQGARIVSA